MVIICKTYAGCLVPTMYFFFTGSTALVGPDSLFEFHVHFHRRSDSLEE
jgi:hypothetical protein